MAESKLIVRLYDTADDKRIEEIVKTAWPSVTIWKKLEDGHGWRGSKPWWRYKLDPVLAHAKAYPDQVVIATLNEEVVGYAMFTINTDTRIGQVLDNAVDPAHTGKGVGSAMQRAVLRAMKDAGMTLAKVGTGLGEAQASARRMYEKNGFREVFREVIYVRTLNDLDT
jgi:ribosomal protein S18 acetylase RimI-like enzyme